MPLVLHPEVACIGDNQTLRTRHKDGDPLADLHGQPSVVAAPDDEGRDIDRGQPSLDLGGVILVELGEVAQVERLTELASRG